MIFDADTQFCCTGSSNTLDGKRLGEADVLARSKSTSVDADEGAGVLPKRQRKVRPSSGRISYRLDPRTDVRTPRLGSTAQLIAP